MDDLERKLDLIQRFHRHMLDDVVRLAAAGDKSGLIDLIRTLGNHERLYSYLLDKHGISGHLFFEHGAPFLREFIIA